MTRGPGPGPLSIDTALASASLQDVLSSGQSTPKATLPQPVDASLTARHERNISRPSSPTRVDEPSSFKENAAKVAVAAGLASTIGYFASAPRNPTTKETWKDDLPSVISHDSPKTLPAPADSVSKGQSNISESIEAVPNLDEHREKTLEALTGSQEGLAQQSQSRELEASIEPKDTAADQDESAFVSKKSKKDKKKDKKGKGLSRSSTQDESSLPAASEDTVPVATPAVESEPVEEFISAKSKKEQKKNKRKGKSASVWDEGEPVSKQTAETMPESDQGAPSSTSVVDVEKPASEGTSVEQPGAGLLEEFAAPKSKGKKKDKQKKSTLSWEPEPQPLESQSGSAPKQSPEPAPIQEDEAARDLKEADAQPDVPLPAEEPPTSKQENEENNSVEVQRTTESDPSIPEGASASQDMKSVEPQSDQYHSDEDQFYDAPLPADPEASAPPPDATAEDLQSSEVFVAPSKKSKKDKKKFKSVSTPDPVGDAALEPSQEPAPTVNADVTSTPAETEHVEFFTSKSTKDKKDKKKGKSAKLEDDGPATSQIPAAGSSRDVSGDNSAIDDPAPLDDPAPSKTKGKKSQKGNSSSWEPEVEGPLVPEPPPSAPDTENLPQDEPTPADDFENFPTSAKDKKKDKKKKNKSVIAVDTEEDDASKAVSTPSMETGPEILDAPAPAPPEDFQLASSKDRKKDKKKKNDHSDASLEPEASLSNTGPALVEEPQPVVEEAAAPASALGEKQLEPVTALGSVQSLSENVQDSSLKLVDIALPEPQASDESSQKLESTEVQESKEPAQEPEITEPVFKAEIQDPVVDTRDENSADVSSTPAKKSKKNKKDKSSMNWADEVESSLPGASNDSKLPNEISLAEDAPPTDDFDFAETKKGKKKKGKSKLGGADEVESSLPESSLEEQPETESVPVQHAPPVDKDLALPGSKKGKKNKNKAIASWDHGEDSPPATASQKDEPADFTTFVSSKKGKKKGKKSSSWDEPETGQDELPDAETKTSAAPEAGDGASSSKEGNEKNRKSQPLDDASQANATQEALDSEDPPAAPADGPGTWPITPATPTAGGEQLSDQPPSSASKGFFPAAAAALGAAIFGKLSTKDDPSSQGKEVPPEMSSSTPEMHDEKSLGTESNTAPDGLAAGYNNDQLSLARQLQEEFGKKSSKKDKKKRQSLPATPPALASRSRPVDATNDDHPRARSLSAEIVLDESGVSPTTTERQNFYSEDQLELARQLKAGFETGGKKSKKDKKGKKGNASTLDDAPFGQEENESSVAGPESGAAQPTETPDTAKPDGFEAGYQEEQLSLARQLQAEFGKKDKKKEKRGKKGSQTSDADTFDQDSSEPRGLEAGPTEPTDLPSADTTDATKSDGLAAGYQEDQLSLARQMQADFAKRADKKTGKKGKKSRSTSRTPGEEMPRDDYFGNESQAPSSEQPAADELPALPESPAIDESEAVHDELAVAYNSEQLDLARQLKEEIGSGSSKKGKKDKKRGSLLRTNTEDESSSTPSVKDEDFQESAESPQVESTAAFEKDDEFPGL